MREGIAVDDDIDVQHERARVESPDCKDLVKVRNLTKTFTTAQRAKLTAVNGLSFGMNKGECFGLLGVNGLGQLHQGARVVTPATLQGLARQPRLAC